MLEIGKIKDKRAPILRGEEIIAVLATSNWKEDATLTRGQTVWYLHSSRGKRLIGTLSTDPEVVGTGEQARFFAQQSSWWRGTWDITLEGVRYSLAPASFWRGTHRVDRNGQQVALSGRAGTWSTRVTLDAADDVPVDHQLFLLWMLLTLQRRANNAAAGTAIAGGTAAAGSS